MISNSNNNNNNIENKHISISSELTKYSSLNNGNLFSSNIIFYHIKLISPYKKWKIKKRYSEFYEFNNVLKNKIKNLPKFPKKSIFSLNENEIHERGINLESYLNNLFKLVNILNYNIILEFISMPKEIILIYQTSLNLNKRIEDILNYNKNYYNDLLIFKINDSDTDKSPNCLVIEEFLRNLDEHKEKKSEIIQAFEFFLKSSNFGRWPIFNQKEIEKFFNGMITEDKNCSYLNGFLYHIGNIQINPIGSQNALIFLGKLLSDEFNPQGDEFIKIFKTTKIEKILNMEIEKHINFDINKIQLSAFSVLEKYIENSKNVEKKIKRILNNKDAEEKFMIWWKNKGMEREFKEKYLGE